MGDRGSRMRDRGLPIEGSQSNVRNLKSDIAPSKDL